MSYNTELQSNNEELATILETASNLPEAAAGTAEGAVLYTEQTLTADQQAQARTNIGAQVAGDYALRSEVPSSTITMTGVDASGTTHTWTVYGSVIS